MRSLSLSLIALLLFNLPAGAQEPVAGTWQGAIVLPTIELEFSVELTHADGAWTGTIDIPAQGAEDVPLAGVTVQGSAISFVIEGVPGTPTFKGTLSGEEIAGDFTQGGQTFPFSMKRGESKPLHRPQEPKPPFPYQSEEVSYPNGDITLAGTLTQPSGPGPHPAVLLITGSGPQNRDEELMGHKPFLVIADHLTRHGFAVLRVDDRGVGGSTGDVNTSTSADFAQDVLAGVRFLQKRDDIDDKRIGLLGHSEGGIVGPLAASQSKDVAFLISLAGPGIPGRAVLDDQRRRIGKIQGVSDEDIAEADLVLTELLDFLETGPGEEELEQKIDAISRRELAKLSEEERASLGDNPEAVVKAQTRMVTTPWFRYFLGFDPLMPWADLEIPVLLLFGANDLQVHPEVNRPPLEEVLADHPDATVLTLPGLNHLFQTAATGSPSEYFEIEETMAPAALDTITQWLTERFATRE